MSNVSSPQGTGTIAPDAQPESYSDAIIRDPGAAAKFDAHFERMWDAAQ